MEQKQLAAQPRVREAKGSNRRLRAEGNVPAIIYGGKGEPSAVSISHHELELILRGARKTNKIFNLALADQTEPTLLREIQRHPVTSRIIHVDFQRIDLEQEIEVDVPLHATGQIPLGVRNGGILEHVQRAVRIACRPLSIPQHIEVDLSDLDMNRSFHVSDLKLAEGLRVIDEPETALFAVVAPKGEETATGTDAAEPEVIGAKKEEKAE